MRVVILFLLILALSLDAEALAVASDYLESNIMEMEEETSRIYSIRIQNPDPVESRAKVSYNKENMEAIGFKEEYIIPVGGSVAIQFNITAPKYNKKNNLFNLDYTVHQLTHASGAGTQFLTSIHKKIKLQVVKSPNRLHINYFNVAYAVILLLIIFFLYKNRNISNKIKFKKKISWARKFK